MYDNLSAVTLVLAASAEPQQLDNQRGSYGDSASLDSRQAQLISQIVDTVRWALAAWKQAAWTGTALECEVQELVTANAQLSWLYRQLCDSRDNVSIPSNGK